MRKLDIQPKSYEEVQKRRSRALLKRWKTNKEELIKQIIAGTHKRPTKPERKLETIMEAEKLPFTYSADKGVIINGRCPDFIRNDGKKRQVIEMFGIYWHSPLYKPTINNPRRSKKAVLKDYHDVNYDCLIVWENEVRSEDSIIQKIRTFIGD